MLYNHPLILVALLVSAWLTVWGLRDWLSRVPVAEWPRTHPRKNIAAPSIHAGPRPVAALQRDTLTRLEPTPSDQTSVTARIECTLDVLDQWISEADEEIARLEQLLTGTPHTTAFAAPSMKQLSGDETETVARLHNSGFTVSEISDLVALPEAAVRRALGRPGSDSSPPSV